MSHNNVPVRSRGVLNLRGCCPMCGREVHRRVTRTAALASEVYHCPLDGDVRYESGARATVDTAYGLSGTPPWWEGPLPEHPVQETTGLLLVA